MPAIKIPGRRTPLGGRPLAAAKIGARGYCGPAGHHDTDIRVDSPVLICEPR